MRIRDRLEERFPIFQKIPKLFGQEAITVTENLTLEERELMNKFKVGMANALGVPPEAIKEDVLYKWVKDYSRAFIKPEYWSQIGIDKLV